jgi:hypothetical protein
MFDHTFLWQSSHPDNPKMNKDRTWAWMQQQWQFVGALNPKAVVHPVDFQKFDDEVMKYDFIYSPEWPIKEMVGKRDRYTNQGEYFAADKWIDRLIMSIKRKGIIDPLIGVCHEDTTPIGVPNLVMGSNRKQVCDNLGIKTAPLITSWPKGKKYPFDAVRISPEDFHDEYMKHRADLWVAPYMFSLVHPPTRFHDDEEGFTPDPQQQMLNQV